MDPHKTALIRLTDLGDIRFLGGSGGDPTPVKFQTVGGQLLLGLGIRSFQKNVPFFSKEGSVLSVLFRSFPFFAKEGYVLSILFRSLEKNGKECNVLFLEQKRL